MRLAVKNKKTSAWVDELLEMTHKAKNGLIMSANKKSIRFAINFSIQHENKTKIHNYALLIGTIQTLEGTKAFISDKFSGSSILKVLQTSVQDLVKRYQQTIQIRQHIGVSSNSKNHTVYDGDDIIEEDDDDDDSQFLSGQMQQEFKERENESKLSLDDTIREVEDSTILLAKKFGALEYTQKKNARKVLKSFILQIVDGMKKVKSEDSATSLLFELFRRDNMALFKQLAQRDDLKWTTYYFQLLKDQTYSMWAIVRNWNLETIIMVSERFEENITSVIQKTQLIVADDIEIVIQESIELMRQKILNVLMSIPVSPME